MSKVYFKRVETKDYQTLSTAAKELLVSIVEETGHQFAKEVPIKVHFGERGNKTYIPAECYGDVIQYLKEHNVAPSYIETNVLYRGSRTTKEIHEKTARDHGFTNLPIIIADGEAGEAYEEIVIDKTYFKSCKIGAEYGKYNQFVVMSHFKGHGMAGFGGALKQLAMGFAARGGKLAQHSEISPKVDLSKCITCGLCVKKCDVDAIEILDKAHISPSKCIGCAGCIAVCPVGAIQNSWEGADFKQKVAEYAYGAQKGKDNIYINFLINITEECDCMGQVMKPIANDIGVLASKDPVALDAACLDLLQKEHGTKLFESGRESIVHAVEIGLGSDMYQLIEK